MADDNLPARIAALAPDGPGHQFVFYGDACSGVPGAPHEATFACTNRVVARLDPPPEFIVFPGDEIIGLTADEAALRAQWRHWHEVEMAWLDRRIPVFHTTSNHATYDAMSERVFADVLAHLPRNGPLDQPGLSYWVRRGDLLLVAVHTGWTGLGGEGHVETDWLRRVLADHADARFKLVVGHHPVWPVNGFAGDSQREIAAEHGAAFWRILVEQGVLAYMCSHILAFDVQAHDGVLQVLSAGAGTAHRMPAEIEYLHAVQMALDARGLRYQVLDQTGAVRERLTWPPALPPSDTWRSLPAGEMAAPLTGSIDTLADDPLVAFRFAGRTGGDGAPQTLLAAWDAGPALAPLWIGLTGRTRRLTVTLAPQAGRSPHYWFGPDLGDAFDVQLALHAGMGPGGLLWRAGDEAPWSSLMGASAWGVERLRWPARWSFGHGKGGAPFHGDLTVNARLP